MKTTKTILGIVAGAALLACQDASAILNYDLNFANSGISSYTGPYASVTITRVNTTTADFVFTAYSGFLIGAPGVNVNVGNVNTFTLSNLTPNGSFDSGNKENGFGNFNVVDDTGSANSDRVSSISFRLTATGASWNSDSDILALNNKGFLLASHVYVMDGSRTLATGFAANGSGTESAPDGGTTIMLLGSSLAGLGMISRRFKK